MPDLYEILRVERTADAAAIKKAYREAAKRAHPDAGGSPEAFAKIGRALAVLTDPKARAHYDQTGEAEEPPPDNHAAQIAGMLSAGLSAALQHADQIGRPYTAINIPDAIANALRAQRLEAESNAGKILKHIEKLVLMQPLFLSTRADGVNHLGAIVAGQISALHQQRAKLIATVALLLEAETIARSHYYKFDEPPRVVGGIFGGGLFSGAVP